VWTGLNTSPQYRTTKKNQTILSASDIGADEFFGHSVEIHSIESVCVTVHHHFIVQPLLGQFVLLHLLAGGGFVNKVNRLRARSVPRWVTHKRTHAIACLKACPHCRRKVRLSPKTPTVAFFCDSLTFLRQCGQGFTLHTLQVIPHLVEVAASQLQTPTCHTRSRCGQVPRGIGVRLLNTCAYVVTLLLLYIIVLNERSE